MAGKDEGSKVSGRALDEGMDVMLLGGSTSPTALLPSSMMVSKAVCLLRALMSAGSSYCVVLDN